MDMTSRPIPMPMPAAAYQTYQISAPLQTHFRRGTCEEANCPALIFGWRSVIDERTQLGQMQAHGIRTLSGRRFGEERSPEGLTVFTFPAGQSCFERHYVRLEREEFFLRVGGDYRGNPRGEFYRHAGPGSWLDDFATHQDRIATRIERG